MIDTAPLRLFNSLTRQLEEFCPLEPGKARVYSCGPTVYNYQHIGNMRAYVFADTLGRVLSYKGYDLQHVINITDVGHLTSDADAGDDKMEKAASAAGKSAWDIAAYYQADFERDLARLNIRKPQHPKATDYVEKMIDWAKSIEAKHCYRLESGLYFDVSTVPDYGRLAREDDLFVRMQRLSHRQRLAIDSGQSQFRIPLLRETVAEFVEVIDDFYHRKSMKKYETLSAIWTSARDAEDNVFYVALEAAIHESRSFFNTSRVEPVAGKHNDEDFAIWRITPIGETRQMQWDSPWGKGAPGWHIECSVMSKELLGHPFDIHTGGIDHREIHHPNEIAQNQAHGHCEHSGANIWMHNNFLIDRRGKMSKSAGEFLRLQTLIDRGFHPLAYRLMCLQAHYRSELEFSWEGLLAAQTRLKRMVLALNAKEVTPGSGDIAVRESEYRKQFGEAVSDDLNTPLALTIFEAVLGTPGLGPNWKRSIAEPMEAVLGLEVLTVGREDLRIRPVTAQITEPEIEAALARRKDARAAKDFATSDAIRDDLIAKGVEVMDGDPLGWDWKIEV